jgi:antitoxin PrlF
MSLSKLSSKAQIVLPAPIRRKLNIKPGDELEISVKDNVIIVCKAPQSVVDALDSCGSGIWRGYEKELNEARDQWIN